MTIAYNLSTPYLLVDFLWVKLQGRAVLVNVIVTFTRRDFASATQHYNRRTYHVSGQC